MKLRLMNPNTGNVNLLVSAALVVGFSPLFAAGQNASPKRGTDVLHLAIRADMENGGLVADAAGSVYLQYHSQGKVTLQNLDIAVQSLAPLASYGLFAELAGGGDLIQVAEMQTDSSGNFVLRYRLVAHSHGKSQKLGKGQSALPELLNPLSGVRKLVVAAVSGTEPTVIIAPVLIADFSNAARFNYLVKRDLSALDVREVRASLQVNANQKIAGFRLLASGLAPGEQYYLALGDGVDEAVSEHVADGKGRLLVQAPVEPSRDVLRLHLVELRRPIAPATDTQPTLYETLLTTNLP